jgi:hypothetical protein
MDERTADKINAIYAGVKQLADGANSYDSAVRQELKYAFGKVHSVILNTIAVAVLEAIAEREHDNRFYPAVKEAARLVGRLVK